MRPASKSAQKLEDSILIPWATYSRSSQATGQLRSHVHVRLKIENGPPPPLTMPSSVTSETILDTPSKARVLKVDANVIAYFGDYFHAFCQGMHNAITIVTPGNSVRRDPSNTASARNPS